MEEVQIIKSYTPTKIDSQEVFFDFLCNKIAESVYHRIEKLITDILDNNKVEPVEYLKINDLTKLFGVSRTTIYNWKNKGIIKPCSRAGRSPLFSKKEITENIKINNNSS